MFKLKNKIKYVSSRSDKMDSQKKILFENSAKRQNELVNDVDSAAFNLYQ